MLRVSGNDIYASGIVGYEADGFTRDQMQSALMQVSGDITLHLQSPGGDVFEGHSIYNQLRAYSGAITCMVDTLSGSISTVIQCAAEKVVANMNSNFMVHGPSVVAMGQATDLRQLADQLDKLRGDAADVYAAKSGTDRHHWLEVMSGDDQWYSAQEAKSAGLVDEIAGEVPPEPSQLAGAMQAVFSTTRLQAERVKADYRAKLVDYLRRK